MALLAGLLLSALVLAVRLLHPGGSVAVGFGTQPQECSPAASLFSHPAP